MHIHTYIHADTHKHTISDFAEMQAIIIKSGYSYYFVMVMVIDTSSSCNLNPTLPLYQVAFIPGCGLNNIAH